MSPSEAGGGAGDLNTFAQHANLYVLNVFYVFAQHARSLVISLDGVWFVGVKTWVSVCVYNQYNLSIHCGNMGPVTVEGLTRSMAIQ